MHRLGGDDLEARDCDSFWEICQETLVTLKKKTQWILATSPSCPSSLNTI